LAPQYSTAKCALAFDNSDLREEMHRWRAPWLWGPRTNKDFFVYVSRRVLWALSETNIIACLAENIQKGGDPAAGSPTATLLRLNPSHWSHRGRLLPCG